MKKLSLKKLNLGVNDMLQRNQLKAIYGGYNVTITCTFPDGTYWQGSSGNYETIMGMFNHCAGQGGEFSRTNNCTFC